MPAMFSKPMPRPAIVKKPIEKEMVGQVKPDANLMGHKAPFLSRLVGSM